MNDLTRVVFASDCEPCECCDDVICNQCGEHYADCECPGPTQDDIYDYVEIDGILYAKVKT